MVRRKNLKVVKCRQAYCEVLLKNILQKCLLYQNSCDKCHTNDFAASSYACFQSVGRLLTLTHRAIVMLTVLEPACFCTVNPALDSNP